MSENRINKVAEAGEIKGAIPAKTDPPTVAPQQQPSTESTPQAPAQPSSQQQGGSNSED